MFQIIISQLVGGSDSSVPSSCNLQYHPHLLPEVSAPSHVLSCFCSLHIFWFSSEMSLPLSLPDELQSPFPVFLNCRPLSPDSLASDRRRHGSSELPHTSFPLQTFLSSYWRIPGFLLLLNMCSIRANMGLGKHMVNVCLEKRVMWEISRKRPSGMCFRKAEMKTTEIERTDAHSHRLNCISSRLKCRDSWNVAVFGDRVFLKGS